MPTTPTSDPTVVRRRNLARAGLLKRRVTAASVLGFAAFFALAAQHVVRGASSSARHVQRAARQEAAGSTTSYFDQRDGGFSFASPASGFAQQAPTPQPQPMAQSSVS